MYYLKKSGDNIFTLLGVNIMILDSIYMKNTQIKFKLSKCLCDFIPIILICFFVFFPKEAVPFSHTILGRFLAVLLIVFYSKKSVVLGLLMCIIVIYYYQMENFEYMLNVPEGFLWDLTTSTGKTEKYEKDFTPYKYEEYDKLNNDLKERFQKEHCVNGELIYKETRVNPEMSEHVFSELQFEHSPCNPCNPSCKFSIIEQKIKTEEELVKPKNSNEWFDTIFSRIGSQ
jgi:hypothetical protein